METYILVLFWLYCLGATLRGGQLIFGNYPRIDTSGVGADAFRMIENLAFAFWAAILLWGN